MANLIYYIEEKKIHSEAFCKELDSKSARIVLSKLVRHYKLPEPYLKWTSGRNHPHANRNTITLNLTWNNFGVLCHELAHFYQQNDRKMVSYYIRKGNHRWHDKKHTKIMKRMIDYCKKKNWFANELIRRTATKTIQVPNALEVKQKELIKAQEKIVKYEKKVMFYQRKLAKAKKSYNMRKRHFESKNLSQNPVIAIDNEQSNTLAWGENEH